jgi:hypothetical protein
MYARYDHDFYYWEGVIMARKFLIVMAALFFSELQLVQATVTIVILVVYLFFHTLVSPYAVEENDQLEALLTVVQVRVKGLVFGLCYGVNSLAHA